MNVFVFVKRVPDTESKIRINPDGNGVVEEGLNFVLNPYDEYAVEEAIRLRDAHDGKTTVFSIGNDETRTVLRKCLAMGIDEAVLIKDESPETYDGLRTAKILAHALSSKYKDFSLLLFGKQAVGTDNSQIPSMVAALLDLPQVNMVIKLDVEGNTGTAQREIEGAAEIVTFSLPAVVSAQKGLNEPRYETLKGIMMAKKKEIPVVSLQDLGLNEEDVSAKMELIKMESPPPREAGTIVEDEPETAVKKLVEFLHNEAKII